MHNSCSLSTFSLPLRLTCRLVSLTACPSWASLLSRQRSCFPLSFHAFPPHDLLYFPININNIYILIAYADLHTFCPPLVSIAVLALDMAKSVGWKGQFNVKNTQQLCSDACNDGEVAVFGLYIICCSSLSVNDGALLRPISIMEKLIFGSQN